MVAPISEGQVMQVKLQRGVRIRRDDFGSVCYVPHRDDFFALDHQSTTVASSISSNWTDAEPKFEHAYRTLAGLGICVTREPVVEERAYSGPSFIGTFLELPTVSEPLVVNCFATSHCPLKCVYCHADDLMAEFRPSEVEEDLENVIATAISTPSIVAVITGGDPLTRPERSLRLIRALGGRKALVLDTSGAGHIEPLISDLVSHDVHVRVSLDSIDPKINSRVRPVNKKYNNGNLTSLGGAERTIDLCQRAKIPLTVQSVFSSQNTNPDDWRQLRNWIVLKGIRNWVIHVAVRGGIARSKPRVLPDDSVRRYIVEIIKETQDARMPLDIRCTDTDSSPNSVLLIGSKGDLFTEGQAHHGKVKLYSASSGRPDLLQSQWTHVDRFGHARRYLNWVPWIHGDRSIEDLCIPIPFHKDSGEDGEPFVETEAKFVVVSIELLTSALVSHGWKPSEAEFQRDEYYDDNRRTLESLDYVVRLRLTEEAAVLGLKGARFYTDEGLSSRIELEFSASTEAAARAELARKGLQLTWYFEKRRTNFTNQHSRVVVSVDEIPDLGFYAEVEGPIEQVRSLLSTLEFALGHKEKRNYRDAYIAHMIARGASPETIEGAAFIHAVALAPE